MAMANLSAPSPSAAGGSEHRIRIGCAGWNIPRQHRDVFSEHGSALQRYASRLDAVEINSSFYRPHLAKTYARWAASVPEHFRFSVKVPKSITHEHALLGTASLLDQFLDECLALDDKLSGLLMQLPPRLEFDGRRANAFFGSLRRRLPENVAIACEPRHPAWFGEQAREIWERYQVNRIAADPASATWTDGDTPGAVGQWRYWRLHGSPRRYFSAYSESFLASLAPLLRQVLQTTDAWVIFDNTAHGHAIADALKLQDLMTNFGIAVTHAESAREIHGINMNN